MSTFRNVRFLLLFALAAVAAAQQAPDANSLSYRWEFQVDPDVRIIAFSEPVSVPIQPPPPGSQQPFQPPQQLFGIINQLRGVEMAMPASRYSLSVRKAGVYKWEQLEEVILQAARSMLAPGAELVHVPDKNLPPGANCVNLVVPNVPMLTAPPQPDKAPTKKG